MIDRTELDTRYAAHAMRVARVNREGWRLFSPKTALQPPGTAAVMATGESTTRRPRVRLAGFIPSLLRRAAI